MWQPTGLLGHASRVNHFTPCCPGNSERTLAIRCGQWRAAEGCRAWSNVPLEVVELPGHVSGCESAGLTGKMPIGNQEEPIDSWEKDLAVEKLRSWHLENPQVD